MMLTVYTVVLACAVMLVDGQVCNHYTISGSQSVIISSQDFPDKYGTYTDDCWVFENSNANKNLKIEFRNFETEDCCDVVDVYDGSDTFDDEALVETISGFIGETGPTVYSIGSSMTVHFTTDVSSNFDGWQACICDALSSCSCDWIEIPDWWYDDTDDDTLDITSGLPLNIWIGIGVGVSLLALLPIIIGVSVACCCGCRAKQKHRSSSTSMAMTTINTANLPPGTYPTQAGVVYGQPQTVAAPTGPVQYADPYQPGVQVNTMGPTEAPYTQAPPPGGVTGVYPAFQTGTATPGGEAVGTGGVQINMTQPAKYTPPPSYAPPPTYSSTSPPAYSQ